MSCDTLLLLGCDFAWRQFYPEKARMIQVDVEPTHLGRRHPVELGVVGDVKATLSSLLPLLTARTDRAFLDDSVARHTRAIETLGKRAAINHGERFTRSILPVLLTA